MLPAITHSHGFLGGGPRLATLARRSPLHLVELAMPEPAELWARLVQSWLGGAASCSL